jgi:hypothetical protein
LLEEQNIQQCVKFLHRGCCYNETLGEYKKIILYARDLLVCNLVIFFAFNKIKKRLLNQEPKRNKNKIDVGLKYGTKMHAVYFLSHSRRFVAESIWAMSSLQSVPSKEIAAVGFVTYRTRGFKILQTISLIILSLRTL